MKYFHSFFIALILFTGLGVSNNSFAQHSKKAKQDTLRKNTHHHQKTPKITSLREIFKYGHFHGHFRNYFMATVNYEDLTDFYANGIGGLIEYETAEFYGFQFALSGLVIFNLFSSDFTELDEITNKHSRYELELFDVEDPNNRSELDRFDELYIQYRFKNSRIRFGKQGIKTPLMNKQDTRMKPYVLEGIWTDLNPSNHLKINAGWFYRASVRATTEWTSLEESIGIYEQGFNPDGSPSHYKHHLKTKGVGVFGLTYSQSTRLKSQIWNYWIENISNSTFLQADFSFPLKHDHEFLLGAQLLRQQTLQDGGNSHLEQTYFQPNQENYVYSFKVGWRSKISELTLNYQKADQNGRFTFPREWGREHFYTTVSRGRIEGMGNVQTVMAIWKYKPSKKTFFQLDLGHVFAPKHTDYEFNKYGNVENTHLNIHARYHFDKKWDGLQFGFLYTHKRATDNFDGNLAPLYYNANYHHFNFVTNIKF